MPNLFNDFFLKEEEEREEITPELVARLVTRPEDLPQNVAANIKKFRDMMLRTLEVLPGCIDYAYTWHVMYNERHGSSFLLRYGDGTVTQGSQDFHACTGQSSKVQLHVHLTFLRSLPPITTVAYHFLKTLNFCRLHVFFCRCYCMNKRYLYF